MITNIKNKKGSAAITSDLWHVVHSRLIDSQIAKLFSRHVSSEHPDRAACVAAARALLAKLRAESPDVPQAERDEVFVRRPGYKSLKTAKRRTPRRSA